MPTSPDPLTDPAFARQRLAAVAAVSSVVTHSGRNRLAVARAALELLQARMEGDLTDEQRASFLHQLDLFLREFNLGVDALRCHEPEIGRVDVREVAVEATEAVRSQAEPAGVALQLEFAEAAADALADRGLVRLVLLNLLRNALEALPGTPAPRVRVRGGPAEKRYRLEVEDNGPGIAPEVRSRLFREFATTRRGAAGLGLSLCRDAMSVMGGSIAWLGPRGTPGAIFRLELPLA